MKISTATPTTPAATRDTIASRRPIESLRRPTAGSEVAPVEHGVERPAECFEEAHVEDLHDGQQAEDHSDKRRHYLVSPWAAGRERGRRTRSPSSGMRTNALGVRRPISFGAMRANHTSRQARTVISPFAAALTPRRAPAVPSPGTRSERPSDGCPVRPGPDAPVAPQPPHVAAERLGKQGQRSGECGVRHEAGQNVRRRERQHDALGRRDDLAPVARRQRPAQPRQQPAGRDERVARRADREHPRAGRAGDVHAQDQDQETRRPPCRSARRASTPFPCAARPSRRPRRGRARRP